MSTGEGAVLQGERAHADRSGLERVQTVPTRQLLVRWTGRPDPSQHELQQAFGPYELAEGIQVPNSPEGKYAFIKLRSYTAAQRAVEALDGKSLGNRAGTRLALCYSPVRDRRSACRSVRQWL
jgi:hypothetical protein